MHSTNTLRRNIDKSETKPKAKKKLEIETHIKPNLGRKGSVYRKRFNTISFHIILPCDPVALVERLDILMASKAAGNTANKERIGISLQ